MKKDPIHPVKILSAGDLSQATVTTNPTYVVFKDNVGYEVVVAAGADAVGTVDVECSLNYNPTTRVTGDWVPLGISASCPIDGAGSGIIDYNQAISSWVRLKYTRTSGSGSMDVYITAKEV